MGIKPQISTEKFSKKEASGYANKCQFPQTNVFSLKNIVQSKTFSFEYFDKAKSDLQDAIIQCFNKLQEMSKCSLQELYNKGKQNGGIEPLAFSEFTEQFRNAVRKVETISDDEKLYVIRFNSQKYRMILRRGSKCRRVLNILGFEFKLGTAYRHN